MTDTYFDTNTPSITDSSFDSLEESLEVFSVNFRDCLLDMVDRAMEHLSHGEVATANIYLGCISELAQELIEQIVEEYVGQRLSEWNLQEDFHVTSDDDDNEDNEFLEDSVESLLNKTAEKSTEDKEKVKPSRDEDNNFFFYVHS